MPFSADLLALPAATTAASVRAASTRLRAATPLTRCATRGRASLLLLCSSLGRPRCATMASASPVLKVEPLGFPYATADPFLFAVYHNDKYPAGSPENMFAPRKGNGADFDCECLAPRAPLARSAPGRDAGSRSRGARERARRGAGASRAGQRGACAPIPAPTHSVRQGASRTGCITATACRASRSTRTGAPGAREAPSCSVLLLLLLLSACALQDELTAALRAQGL